MSSCSIEGVLHIYHQRRGRTLGLTRDLSVCYVACFEHVVCELDDCACREFLEIIVRTVAAFLRVVVNFDKEKDRE